MNSVAWSAGRRTRSMRIVEVSHLEANYLVAPTRPGSYNKNYHMHNQKVKLYIIYWGVESFVCYQGPPSAVILTPIPVSTWHSSSKYCGLTTMFSFLADPNWESWSNQKQRLRSLPWALVLSAYVPGLLSQARQSLNKRSRENPHQNI